MKRLSIILAILLLMVLVLPNAQAMDKDYVWNGQAITFLELDDRPMLVPVGLSDSEYAAQIKLQVAESLWKDDDLRSRLFEEIALVDASGYAYAPSASMVSVNEPYLFYTFSIPKTLSADTLLLQFSKPETVEEGISQESTGSATNQTPAQFTASDGSMITLTPLAADEFLRQNDSVIVHTRIGTTEHNGGSRFTQGSGLKLGTMRNTKQYDMPMIAFRYTTSLDFDSAVDEIGIIGESAVLEIDGTPYAVQVAWITRTMGCYIFSCPTLAPEAATFSLVNQALVITP